MINKFGLQPLKEDSRDLSLGYIFNLPKLEELPETFILGNPTVVDQKDSYFCAAASSCAVSELQEGVPLGFEWVYAVAKNLDGKIEEGGTDLRTICKVHTKYGAIERTESPYSLQDKSIQFLEILSNWPVELFSTAKKHQKKSYLKVTGCYDHYDCIRASIFKFKEEKRGVLLGVKWSWPLSQIIMDSENEGGGGHAIACVGWTKDGLIIQNSYGKEAGNGGWHYFSREIINKYVGFFGAFMFVDLDPEVASYMQSNGIKHGDNWIVQLYKIIKQFLSF